MDYSIDPDRDEYVCRACGRRYPRAYKALGWRSRNRKNHPGIAWANFRRHLKGHEPGQGRLIEGG